MEIAMTKVIHKGMMNPAERTRKYKGKRMDEGRKGVLGGV
jgi:hypothetical protein